MFILSTFLAIDVGHRFVWIALYVGPDLLMPLTSALAAIAGVVLIFWQRVVGLVRSAWTALFQRNREPRG